MTTFLFCAVAVSGMAIVNRVPFNRRTRFILTAALALGYGATLVPTWFTYVFTYAGNNQSFSGFLDAIELLMETGFALTALVAMLLNLTLADEIEDTLVVKVEQVDSDVTDEDLSKDQLAVQKVLEV
jgi:xanthine/uracil permease